MKRLEVGVVAEFGLGKAGGATLSQEMEGVVAIVELDVDESSGE
jgi:hypothetical protein